MVTLVLYLIGLVIIDYLVQNKSPIDQPLKNLGRIVVVLLAIVIVVYVVTGLRLPVR